MLRWGTKKASIILAPQKPSYTKGTILRCKSMSASRKPVIIVHDAYYEYSPRVYAPFPGICRQLAHAHVRKTTRPSGICGVITDLPRGEVNRLSVRHPTFSSLTICWKSTPRAWHSLPRSPSTATTPPPPPESALGSVAVVEAAMLLLSRTAFTCEHCSLLG